MKKVLSFLFVIALIFAIPSFSFSQQGYFSIHAGPAFPLGDFGDDDADDNAGGAAVGIDIGGKYVFPIDQTNFGIFGSIDLIYNGLASDVEDDVEDGLSGYNDVDDITFFKYINVPLMAGVDYSYELNNEISIFGEFGLGINICKLTNMTLEIDNDDLEYIFEPSAKMAYKLGGGLGFNNGLSLELLYNSFGKYRIDGEVTYDRETEKVRNFKRLDIGVFTITLAKRF